MSGSSSAATIGTQSTATVTIDDEDSSVLSITSTNGTEPFTDGLFTVSLSNPVSTPTIVTYSVGASSTATAGTDYAALSGTVTIPALGTSATVLVDVTDDNIVETGGETVIATLIGSSSAAIIGSNSIATVTIGDDDFSVISIAATNGAEPSTDGLFTLSLTNPVSIGTVVSYTIERFIHCNSRYRLCCIERNRNHPCQQHFGNNCRRCNR